MSIARFMQQAAAGVQGGGIPWDISTATYNAVLPEFNVATQDTSPQGVFFKPDGTKMYVIGSAGDAVYEYDI